MGNGCGTKFSRWRCGTIQAVDAVCGSIPVLTLTRLDMYRDTCSGNVCNLNKFNCDKSSNIKYLGNNYDRM
eukprot:SAG31_NODE_1622_length_7722_cov_4.332940_6_plen_71_part_00